MNSRPGKMLRSDSCAESLVAAGGDGICRRGGRFSVATDVVHMFGPVDSLLETVCRVARLVSKQFGCLLRKLRKWFLLSGNFIANQEF